MECRPNCGACCIAVSISSPLPGMPYGKPAGIKCIHLTEDYRCALYGSKLRPEVCREFRPDPMICGSNREEAMNIMERLEKSDNL